MGSSHKHRLSVTVALSALAAVILAGAATAGRLFSDTFHEEDTVVIGNFCDVAGLTVEDSFVVDGRVQAVDRSQGAAPPYFLEHFSISDVFTNQANGKF